MIGQVGLTILLIVSLLLFIIIMFNISLTYIKDIIRKISNWRDYKESETILNESDTDIYIDPLSEMYLLGTTIDYVNEDYTKGQLESKFVFEVDKDLMSSCGCGISFSPKVN